MKVRLVPIMTSDEKNRSTECEPTHCVNGMNEPKCSVNSNTGTIIVKFLNRHLVKMSPVLSN